MDKSLEQAASAGAPKVVTLANFAACTDQEVYNHVCYRMARQGFAQSMSDDFGCAYRGPGDMECAAGCCMTNGEYRKLCDMARFETPGWPGGSGLEGSSWVDLQAYGLVPSDHYELMLGLQGAHDKSPTAGEMKAALRELANRRGLSTTYLDGLSH